MLNPGASVRQVPLTISKIAGDSGSFEPLAIIWTVVGTHMTVANGDDGVLVRDASERVGAYRCIGPQQRSAWLFLLEDEGKMMKHVSFVTAALTTFALGCTSALADSAALLQGAWKLKQYTEKGVVREDVGGRVMFSASDIDLVFWVLNADGSVQRSSLLIGTYRPEGKELNVMGGFFSKYVEPQSESDKQKSASFVSNPPKPDPAHYQLEGDSLTLTFPKSGNTMSFVRSSK